jgi:hypothetical protein
MVIFLDTPTIYAEWVWTECRQDQPSLGRVSSPDPCSQAMPDYESVAA